MPKQPTEQEIMEHNLTHTHTCLTDHGVPSAYRDVADQMHIHNEAAADPSYKSILHFKKALRNSTQHWY